MAGKAEKRLFLGLDTSAYTTSLALVDQTERLIWEKRLPLPVGEGELGLRQSVAVFAHLQNLPRLWAEGSQNLKSASLVAVAAASTPRPEESSYMPVFKVSEAFGLFLAQTLGLVFMPFSHQEGHITAGLWSAGLPPGRYLVLHLSGGTTEFLAVEEGPSGQLKIERVGGSADLKAGQFIDRIGVALGLAFPAGPSLEELARRGKTGAVILPVAVKKAALSFSGPASHAGRLLERGCAAADLARAVEVCIADSLVAAVNGLAGLGGFDSIMVVGGVAADAFIRARLQCGIQALPLHFASPQFAGDNAVGLAVQAARQWETVKKRQAFVNVKGKSVKNGEHREKPV
ncbi:MAG: O-sialoglycoprotein endopeptidase [Bacillota bacterium]